MAIEQLTAAERDALKSDNACWTRERDEAREERDFFDRERQNVVESLSATEAEVTRLTEALAAAERALREANRVSENAIRARDAAEARVRELEAADREAAKCIRELSDLRDAAESECAALRAEVERLRTERNEALESLRLYIKETHSIAARTVASLAAANALLDEACPATHDGPRCQEWYRRRDAHLAAQPATAPACTETEPNTHRRGCVCVRCEAEQAVLDAMRDSSAGSLEAQIDAHPGSALSDACRAELARRELKRGS